MAPAAEQITSRELAILLNNGGSDRGFRRDGNTLSDCALVKVPLECQGVVALQVPIHPETALSHFPAIEVLVVWMELGATCEGFAINTVVKIGAISGSIPEIEEALLVSTAGGNQLTEGFFRALGDDIDHAIDGVRSPDGRARTANN